MMSLAARHGPARLDWLFISGPM